MTPPGWGSYGPQGHGWQDLNRGTLYIATKNMKALGLVVSEKKIFLCFSHDAPGAGPVWNPGARLAGFIERTTILSDY